MKPLTIEQQKSIEVGDWGMSKAVMLSIQPKWCELIASGEKTIEGAKTRKQRRGWRS